MRPSIVLAWLLMALLSPCAAQYSQEQWALWKNKEMVAIQSSLSDSTQGKKYFLALAQELEASAAQTSSNNFSILFNLGNLYYLCGDYGKSTLYYRRAEECQAFDGQLRSNLNFVRSQRIDQLPLYFGNVFLRTMNELTASFPDLALTLATFWSLTLICVYAVLKGRGKFRTGVIIFGSLTIFWSTAFVSQLLGANDRSELVITCPEISTRKGPGHIFAEAFEAPLHAGTECRFLESRERWIYVQLSDGRTCWLPKWTATWIVQKK